MPTQPCYASSRQGRLTIGRLGEQDHLYYLIHTKVAWLPLSPILCRGKHIPYISQAL